VQGIVSPALVDAELGAQCGQPMIRLTALTEAT